MRWMVAVMAVGMALVPRAEGATTARSAGPVAYLLMDAESGTVLAERDAHKRWAPASMTKMMTVLLAMERVRDLSWGSVGGFVLQPNAVEAHTGFEPVLPP